MAPPHPAHQALQQGQGGAVARGVLVLLLATMGGTTAADYTGAATLTVPGHDGIVEGVGYYYYGRRLDGAPSYVNVSPAGEGRGHLTLTYLPSCGSRFRLPPLHHHHHHHHCRRSQATAIYLSGPDLCRASSLPPLTGMVVVSNGGGCPRLAVDLYNELDAMGVLAFVWVTPVSCPRVNQFARGQFNPRQGAAMAMMSMPAVLPVSGTSSSSDAPPITASEFLQRHIPTWSAGLATPFLDLGTTVHITVEDPYVRRTITPLPRPLRPSRPPSPSLPLSPSQSLALSHPLTLPPPLPRAHATRARACPPPPPSPPTVSVTHGLSGTPRPHTQHTPTHTALPMVSALHLDLMAYHDEVTLTLTLRNPNPN